MLRNRRIGGPVICVALPVTAGRSIGASMDRLLRYVLQHFIRRGTMIFTTANGMVFTCGDGTGKQVRARFTTARAARLGDRRWSQLFHRYETAAHRHVAQQAGTYVKSTGDGSLATFDRPDRAVQCALGWQTEAKRLGLEL